MKYNSKITDRLKRNLGVSTNDILSKNKMQGNKSATRSAAVNIGKIVNKTNSIDKLNKNLQDKMQGTEQKSVNKPESVGIKAFKKGSMTYIVRNGKEVPLSQLFTDKTLVNNLKSEMMKNNFQGSLEDYLLNKNNS